MHRIIYGVESDPNISVTLTGDDEIFCIRVNLGTISVPMHTRSAVDLHRKLGLAILDWISQNAGTV